MTTSNISLLLEKISAENPDFIADEPKIKEEIATHSAIYANLSIKILSILGGLLGTSAFVSFLGASGLLRDEGTMLVFGILFMIFAVVGNKLANNIIWDTAFIALYVIGGSLISVSLSHFLENENMVLCCFLLIAALTICFSRSFMLVFLAILLLNGCLAGFVGVNDAFDWVQLPILWIGTVLTLLTIYEAKIIASHPVWNQLFMPVQAGFFVSFIIGLVILAQNRHFDFKFNYLWILSLCIGAGTLLLVSKIIQTHNIKNAQYRIAIYAGVLLFLVPTIYAPYVSGAVFALLLAYFYGYKTEIGLSVVALVYFVSQYYYDLQLTLLQKSGILFFSGILLLGAWLFFNKQLTSNEKL